MAELRLLGEEDLQRQTEVLESGLELELELESACLELEYLLLAAVLGGHVQQPGPTKCP